MNHDLDMGQNDQAPRWYAPEKERPRGLEVLYPILNLYPYT